MPASTHTLFLAFTSAMVVFTGCQSPYYADRGTLTLRYDAAASKFELRDA